MRNKLIAIGGTALIAALPLLATESASAAEKCREGSVCTWSKNNFGGTKKTSGKNPSAGCKTSWGGKTVSNQTSRTIKVYSGNSCNGQMEILKPNHWGQTESGQTIHSIRVL